MLDDGDPKRGPRFHVMRHQPRCRGRTRARGEMGRRDRFGPKEQVPGDSLGSTIAHMTNLRLALFCGIVSLAACSREPGPQPIVTPERKKDAGVDAKRDTRPPTSTETPAVDMAPAPIADAGATSGDASANDAASDGGQDGAGSSPDAGQIDGGSGGSSDSKVSTSDAGEAVWMHQGCNPATLMFPMIDKNNGKFPPGSCPPPASLKRDCGNNSAIKVMAATSSPFETGYVHPPGYAIDEHLMSRWSSNSGPSAWLALDLGAEKTFQRIYLAWELAHATDYDVVTSNDGTTWTMLKQVRGGDGFQDIIDVEGKARHVRINGVTRGPTGTNMLYGYSLFDVTICAERP